MAEDDTPKSDDSEKTPTLVIPSREPLPPPPEVSFTRPTLGPTQPKPGRAASDLGRQSDTTPLSQGVQGYGLAITAAVTLAVTLFVFIALGQWLDHRFSRGGTPWFTIVGLLLGVVGGFGSMIRLLSSANRNK